MSKVKENPKKSDEMVKIEVRGDTAEILRIVKDFEEKGTVSKFHIKGKNTDECRKAHFFFKRK